MQIKQTFLAQGNRAFKNGNYLAAIALFEKAIQQTPALQHIIRFNITLAQAKINAAHNAGIAIDTKTFVDEFDADEKIQCTALLITCDKTPFLLERAAYLAEKLNACVENTVLTGFLTKPHSKDNFEQFTNNFIPFIQLQWHSLPKLAKELDRIVQKFQPDLIVVSALYLPPLQLGALFKKRYKIPLLIDTGVDPHALSNLQKIPSPIINTEVISHETSPYSDTWTALSHQLLNYADATLLGTGPTLNIKQTPIDTPTGNVVFQNKTNEPQELRSGLSKVLRIQPTTHSDALVNLLQLQHKTFGLNDESGKRSGKDIVVFWKQNDTGLYGRRHEMVIKYLASRDDVRKVVVIDAPISQRRLLERRQGQALTQDRNIYIKAYEKLLGQLDTHKVSYHVHTYKHEKKIDNIEHDRPRIFQQYAPYLKSIFEKENIEPKNTIFWFYPINHLESMIIDQFKPDKIVVDIVDDHRAWPGVSDAEKAILSDYYQDILRRADLSLANCQPLIDSLKMYAPNIRLAPNGCEVVYDTAEPVNNPMYRELKEFRGNVIGFVGNLESKIDLPLLEKIAMAFPDSLVVLVGSTHSNPAARKLSRFPNVRMLGVVEYQYISAIVARFSVGIVPHLKTILTENMNPLKVLVYLMNHIPVVATDVNNIQKTDAVFISYSHNEFIRFVRKILDGNIKIAKSSFDYFISDNAWKNRLEPHLNEIFKE